MQSNKLVSGFCASNFRLEDVAAVAAGQSTRQALCVREGGQPPTLGLDLYKLSGRAQWRAVLQQQQLWLDDAQFSRRGSLQPATGGTSAFTLLPGLCKELDRSGNATNRGLWPWKMGDRIKAARTQSGYPPVDVTATAQALLGPIPQACTSDEIAPGPGPGTDTTPPTAAITAPSPGALVSGTVAITARVNDNVGVTSVRFLLDAQKVGEEHCCEHMTEVSVLADSTKVSNGPHTLSVLAVDIAGNRNQGAPINIQVFNGTPPPIPPASGPVTCTGELKDKGAISLECVPKTGQR